MIWGFTGGAGGKESACQWRRCKRCLIPGLGRFLAEEMATHSGTLGLGNPMDRGTWWAPAQSHRESGTTERLSTRGTDD